MQRDAIPPPWARSMARERPLHFVDYQPEQLLRETEQMRPLEELSFRRVLDLIVFCRNRLLDDDKELGRMTKTGDVWPDVKARLIGDHGVLYVSDDGFIRNVRYDEMWARVERVRRLISQAGKSSAAKRAKKNAATPQPPVPVEPTPVEISPQQALPEPLATGVEVDPPDAAVPPPEPMLPAPTSGDGNGDGRSNPEHQGTWIPLDWRPNLEGIHFAVARGHTPTQIGLLVGEYVAHNTDKGITSKDWHATWRLWVLRDLALSAPPMGDEA